MMPRQPVGDKPNTVPIPAGEAICTLAHDLEDERAAVHSVQLPFHQKRAILFYERVTNDNYFYVFSKIVVYLRVGY